MCALERLAEVAAGECPKTPESHLAVIQAEAESEAREFAARLKTLIPVPEIPVYELPPAIVTHGGPKTMGVGFFADMV